MERSGKPNVVEPGTVDPNKIENALKKIAKTWSDFLAFSILLGERPTYSRDAKFQGLVANPAVEGAIPEITFAGIVQYSVYQWFMLLLFVVSGMCAKYTLQKKSLKAFMKARKHTLGNTNLRKIKINFTNILTKLLL